MKPAYSSLEGQDSGLPVGGCLEGISHRPGH